jgi:hypothetical protein
MTRLKRIFVIGLFAAVSACRGQAQSDAGTLWRTFFAAGASATEAGNWPEAESFYTAAVRQAEDADPKEPYFTIAQLSLVATYWEENRHDDAIRLNKTLRLDLDPSQISPQLRQTANTLLSLADHFYSAADEEKKQADEDKLQGDARHKADDDVEVKYRIARRYYQWAYEIDKHFMPANSPDLENEAAYYGLACFYAGEYEDAKQAFTELLAIVKESTRRQTQLSQGSLVYSLATGNNPGSVKDDLSIAAISLLLGRIYEGIADGKVKDKPAEAAQDYAHAEGYLTAFVADSQYGNSARIVLARLYREHADLLRKSGRTAQAVSLESKAKNLRPGGD